jgi:hypothetical protein
MALEQNSQLGRGGAGMHGRGPGSAAKAITELQQLRVSILAGAGANTKINLANIRTQDTILSALNNNAGTITDVTGTISIEDLRASGTVTVGTAVASDTVTVAGTTYTLVTSGTVVEDQDYSKVKIGADATATAANLAAAINKRERNRNTTSVIATSAAAVVTVKAYTEGTAGNAITLAEVGTSFTISGATLANGTATGGIKSTGATNSIILFWFEKP